MSAKDFAKIAAQLSQTADLLNPPDSEPYAQACKLAIYHLRSAAKLVRQVAEVKAGKENGDQPCTEARK